MQKLYIRLSIISLIVSLLFISCHSKAKTDEAFLATLWLRASGEYHAICEQTYQMARESLIKALADESWTAALEQQNDFSKLPPAIIFDIDQTILDNSPIKAKMIKAQVDFDAQMWIDWIEDAKIPAINGALEFTNFAKSLGIKIFYVTNRLKEYEKATSENLLYLEFPMDSTIDVILTKNEFPEWTEDKSSRRAYLAKHFRILFMFGDELNDFVSARVSAKERIKLTNLYRQYWGKKWFILPNPIYGSWEPAIYNYDWQLPDEKKVLLRFEHLENE